MERERGFVGSVALMLIAGLTASIMLLSGAAVAVPPVKDPGGGGGGSIPDPSGSTTIKDWDPNVDLNLTVTIEEIWGHDYLWTGSSRFWWTISIGSFRNDGTIVWYEDSSLPFSTWPGHEECHIYPDWSFTADVEDGSAACYINIFLWNNMYYGGDWSLDEPCDISRDVFDGVDDSETGVAEIWESCNAEMTWSLKYGRLDGGDDTIWDQNGMFHLSGIEDGTFGYENDDNDCDLRYSITWNDKDGDGLTWWEELNVYHTNPLVSNANADLDGDGLPLWYEDLYCGCLNDLYPNAASDSDRDGLTAMEEFIFRNWGTAPDCPDILLEIDSQEGYSIDDGFTVNFVGEYLQNYQLPSQDGSSGPYGANIIMDFDEVLPTSVVDPNGDGQTTYAEFESVIDAHFTAGRQGAWRYMLVADEWVWENVMGVTLSDTPREMFIARGSLHRLVEDYNRPLLDPDVFEPHVLSCEILHQLGHSLDIIWLSDLDNDGLIEEYYCYDPSCVMSPWDGHAFHYNRDLPNGPLFCSDHWSLLDLDVWEIAPITELPTESGLPYF